MRDQSPEFTAETNKRGGLRPRTFLRFIAENRDTGAPERLCLWSGIDHQQFSIGGQLDTFYGAGNLLGLSDMNNMIGTGVRSYSLKLAPLAPEVATLLRVYEPAGARFFMYTGLMSTESGLLIPTAVVRRFKGWVDKVKINEPPSGGNGDASLTFVSSARNLTMTTPSRRSDANQKRRAPADDMLRYVAASGQVQTPWGTDRVGGNGPNSGGSRVTVFGMSV